MRINSKQRTKSILLGAAGLLLVVIGIVAGKLILSMVVKNVKSSLCVDSTAHESFQDWKGDASKREATYQKLVYYWNMTNVDGFLHNGEIPKFQQVGPYIYRFASEKADIKFTEDSVRYKSITQTEYDREATMKQCPKCKEDDMLSVINLAYIAVMMAAGGDNTFALNMAPYVTMAIIAQAPDVVLTKLGQKNELLLNNFLSFSNVVQKNFSLMEMRGLYSILSNATLLGTAKAPPSKCITDPIASECLKIGFLPLVQNLQATTHNVTMSVLAGTILSLFCPNITHQCFPILNYLLPVAGYVTNVLVKFTMHFLIDSKQYGLVTTRKQSELSMGYKMMLPGFENGIDVDAFVGNDSDKVKAAASSKFQEYYKCNVDSSTAFAWKSYNGLDFAPTGYHVNTSTDYRKIDGRYRRTIFGLKTSLTGCKTTQEMEHDSYDIFDSTLQTSYRITRKSASVYKTVHVQDFDVDLPRLFNVNNKSVLIKGVLDLSNTKGGVPFLASPPHFFAGDEKLSHRFNMTPNEREHQPKFRIEPISGNTLTIKFGIQVNTAIPKHIVKAPRNSALNVTYVDEPGRYLHPVPIVWVETDASPTDDELKDALVLADVMKGSCAALIVGPVLGLFFIIIAVYIFVKALKTGGSIANVNAATKES